MKAPAFQLYASDFYMDTVGWTPAEVGVYFRLLMYQWVNGSVPNDPEKMARIAGCDKRSYAKMLQIHAKFSPTEDNMNVVNLRMEEERVKQSKYRESQKERINRRWENKDSGNTTVEASSYSSVFSLQSSNTKNKKRVSKKLTDDEYFEVLKNNPAYKGIDIDREKAKCEAWCLTNAKMFSRKRLLNWLNRVEKPMTIDRPVTYTGRPKPYSALDEIKEREETLTPPSEKEIAMVDKLIAGIARKM